MQNLSAAKVEKGKEEKRVWWNILHSAGINSLHSAELIPALWMEKVLSELILVLRIATVISE
jgi:hypothetical protein